MRVKANIEIKNAPEKLHRYTVVRRLDDGKLLYYGTYKDQNRAEMAAAELGNGLLVEVNDTHAGS